MNSTYYLLAALTSLWGSGLALFFLLTPLVVVLGITGTVICLFCFAYQEYKDL